MTSDGADAPLTKAEERARRAEIQRVDAAQVRAEVEAARVAQEAKTVRLRALRLAKEAADLEATVVAPKKTSRKAKQV